MLSDVSAATLDATVAGLGAGAGGGGGAVETMLADVSDYDQVEAVVARAVERFGRLDVLISNAGVLSPNGRIHNLTTEDWERAFRVNLLGAVNGIRAAVGVMRPQHAGSIILTASVSGLTAWSHAAPYCATKAAVIQLAKVAAVEYARDGIRVNCVCPGTFRSAIHDDLPPEALDAVAARHPLGLGHGGRTSSARTPTWPATRPAGRPDRRSWSTAGTRRRDGIGRVTLGRFGGGVRDALHEDVGEGLRHVARRELAARLEPEVRVVVHAEPRHGGQPGLEVTELTRVDARLQDGLDPLLVGPAALAELLGPLAGERRELVQEDPDVIGVAVDDIEQLLAEHGQLPRRRATCLRHAIGAEHHLVHHPVVDGGEQILLRADVVVQRALAEIVGDAQLGDAGRVVTAPGEHAGGRVDDRLVARLPVRLAPRVAGRFRPCH